MRKAFLDTNILARFIVGDVPSQQPEVERIFNEAALFDIEYYIIPEVLVEFRYVLSTHYGFTKDEIIESLNAILDLGFIKILDNQNLDFTKVLEIYEKENLSFEDCIYFQTCLQNKLELITFDKKLKKVFEKN